jgi:hypothetical protein
MAADRERLIRERAYAIWQQESRPEGRHTEHWLRGEAEIDAESHTSVTDDGKKVRLPVGRHVRA